EVEPHSWDEYPRAVVAPTRPDRTGQALILGEAVLGCLAEVGNLDFAHETTRMRGHEPVGAAREETPAVRGRRSAVPREREGHQGPSATGAGDHRRELEILVCGRHVPLTRQRDERRRVGAEHPVGGADM